MGSRSRETMRGEQGFGLAESVASVLVVAVIVLALTYVMASSYAALRQTRMREQAVGLAAEAVEHARSLPFSELVHDDDALASDPRVASCTPDYGYSYAYDGDGAGTKVSCEPLVSASGGQFTPHQVIRTVDSTDFTVSTYVTWHDTDGIGSPEDVKRVSVIVEWERNGKDKSLTTSTILSRTRSALPTPQFELTPGLKWKAAQPGTEVYFAHTIENLGVPDRYEPDLLDERAGWVVTFYQDVDEDGSYDSGLDTPLVDTDASGAPDTGELATGETFRLLGVWTVPVGDPLGTEMMTLEMTSGVNPDATQSAAVNLKVGDPVLDLYLHNYPTPPVGDTTAVKALPMTRDSAPTATTLYRYSTNYNATAAGRDVKKGGGKGESNTEKMVNWVFQMPSETSFQGTATATVYAANVSPYNCTGQIKLKSVVRVKTSADTDGQIAESSDITSTYTPPSGSACGVFHPITVSIPNLDMTVAQDNWIEFKVRNDGQDHVLIAYDTIPYPSQLAMPQVFE